MFNRYLCFGGLPKIIELKDEDEIREYVENRYGAALLESITLSKSRTDMQAYLNLLSYVAQNISTVMSPGSLVGELEKRGVGLAKNTIAKYLSLARRGDLLCLVRRIDLKTNNFLTRGDKYYLKDLGLRYFLGRQIPKEEEHGALVENVVYLELKRRYEKVLVGKIGRYMVDFVCSNKGDAGNGCAKRHYYQIVRNPFELSEENERIAPLLILRDNYPKTLLTLEKTEGDCFAGVKCEYIIDWLLKQVR